MIRALVHVENWFLHYIREVFFESGRVRDTYMYFVGGLQAPAVSLPVRHNQRASDVEHATMTVAPTSGGQLCNVYFCHQQQSDDFA